VGTIGVAELDVRHKMKTIVILLCVMVVCLLTTGFTMSGAGENYPTVQSAFDGGYYVRSIPTKDYGIEGKTQVFRVKRDGDELLDEYPLYMRGELYLGWSPTAGKYCLVHVEPERITSVDDFSKLGKVSRLAFYMGGNELFAYTDHDLEKMGLQQHVQTLANPQPGQFVIRGIQQIPSTNQYVFEIQKTTKTGQDTEKLLLDITTGKIFHADSQEKAEQGAAANP
jgi:predicted small secreted protein